MSAFVAGSSGFLLAVLWFDLMFDVQAIGHGPQLPERVLASTAAYYRRVTTDSRPMSLLVVAAMFATFAGIAVEITSASEPRWVAWVSLALALTGIAPALLRTVPAAVRLGARADDVERQSALARSILHEHLVSFAAIAALLSVQLAFA